VTGADRGGSSPFIPPIRFDRGSATEILFPPETIATRGTDNAFPTPVAGDGAGPGGFQSGLTKREYFAVHLFEGVVAKLSVNCTLQDKAKYAVEAADALCKALSAEN
jgi:hypothetical protein